MDLSELQKKKKRSLTVVCTLGLAAIPFELVFGSKDIIKGTSFDDGAVGFVLKGAIMIIVAIPCIVIGFVYHLIRYFYLLSEEKRMYK